MWEAPLRPCRHGVYERGCDKEGAEQIQANDPTDRLILFAHNQINYH